MNERKTQKVVIDFIHLSQAISSEDIPYELLVILEECASCPIYKALAKENLIAYLKTNEKTLSALKFSIDANNELASIRSISKELIENINASHKSMRP